MLDTLQALLTPLIGVVTAYVAYQQYRIRRDERSLVVYDRRLAIFKSAMTLVNEVHAGNVLQPSKVMTWLTEVAEANFLFAEEVPYLLDELFGRLYEYACRSEMKSEGGLALADAALAVEDLRTLVLDVFRPYLRPAGSPAKKSSIMTIAQVKARMPPSSETKTKEDGEIPF